MNKRKKILKSEEIPEFRSSINSMPEDSRIFVDKSIEIAHHIFQLMSQKGIKQKDLAEKMGKSEAEVSKLLAGMHNYTLRSIAKLEAALGATIICTPIKKVSHKFPPIIEGASAINICIQTSPPYEKRIEYGAKVVSILAANTKQSEKVA